MSNDNAAPSAVREPRRSGATLRQPARTATPEGLADESRRSEQVRLNPPDPWTGPKADPELVAAAKALLAHNDGLYHLARGEWAPANPVEVLAALGELAGFLDDLTSGALGMPAWLCDELNERDSRIVDLERRLALLEEGPSVVADVEERVVAIEERLDPKADYRPAGLRYDGCLVTSDDDEDNPLNMLWANHHEPDGTRSAPKGSVMDEPLDDIENGHLRPETWAQMCDCLSEIARATHTVLSGLMEVEDGARPMQQLVANLTRAVASTSPRPPQDVAEALVLETVTRLHAGRREEAAWDLEKMWRFIELYSQGRDKEAEELGEMWQLERVSMP